MKFLYYLYYKIYKTYNRYHKVIKLHRGPRSHADNFVTLFLFSIPLWFTIKYRLWNFGMISQFILTLILAFCFFGLGFFVEKKVRTKAIGVYMNETKLQSVIGASLINIFLLLYLFLWFYLLK